MTIDYLAHPQPLADHQYAVIDRVRVPKLPKSWPLIELVSPMLEPQARLYPWLVPLHELSSGEWYSLMVELSQHSEPNLPPVCSLLLSSLQTPQAVKNALVSAMHLKDEQHKRHILRYYDPRVMFHLHWMLSPWQLFNQLHAQEISRWTFWLDGRWHTLAFPKSVVFQSDETSGFPLAQLQRIGQINQTLKKLPCSPDMARRQEMSRKIDALLEQATTCQLPTPEDCIAFALHGLKQREGFWTAPRMAAFLAQVRQQPDCYRDETSNWSESRWQDMTEIQSSNTAWKN